jgi:hypothetical protein
MKKKRNEWNEGFTSGVTAALLVVRGDEQIAFEILDCCGAKEVRKAALREGDTDIVKLVDEYYRSKRVTAAYRASAAKRYGFLYWFGSRYVEGKERTRSVKAASLPDACDKMFKFLRELSQRHNRISLDQDVTHNGKDLSLHSIKHPIHEYL